MSNRNYNRGDRISSNTKILISKYYVELYKKGLVKTKEEICRDLMISDKTLYYYWSCLDLFASYKYLGNMEKIVLTQTDFSYSKNYAKIWRKFLKDKEEQKKRYESQRRLSEILQLRKLEKQKLQEARENLVKTLGKVYEIKHK